LFEKQKALRYLLTNKLERKTMSEQMQIEVQLSAKQIFDRFITEINSIEGELFSPPQPMDAKDKEICKVDDPFIRSMFGLYTMYLREFNMVVAEARFEPDNKEKEIQARRAETKSDALREIMWMLIRERYNCMTVTDLGLRKNWTLVESESDPMDMLPPGLKGFIMGGRGGK
jgi:hypothetical protein